MMILLGLSSPYILAQAQDATGNVSPTRESPATQSPAPPAAPSGYPDTVRPELSPAEPATSGSSEAGGQSQPSPRDYPQDPMANVPPAGPVQTLTAKTENGVTYLCGGVGKDEAAYMKQTARDHDLMLTFATRRGDYLADVKVTIENARGEPVLQTTCDAPIMLVDMPKSGTYRIHAEAGGYRQDRTARVVTNNRSVAAVVMTWPQTLAQSGATSTATTSTGSSATEGSSSTGKPDERRERPDYQEGPSAPDRQDMPHGAMPRH